MNTGPNWLNSQPNQDVKPMLKKITAKILFKASLHINLYDKFCKVFFALKKQFNLSSTRELKVSRIHRSSSTKNQQLPKSNVHTIPGISDDYNSPYL